MATETTSQPWRFLCFCQDNFSICVSTKGMSYTVQFNHATIQILLHKLEIGLYWLHLQDCNSHILPNKLDVKDPKSTVRRYCIVLHIRKLSIFFKSCHSYSSQIPTTEQCELRDLDLPGWEVINSRLCTLRRSVANEMRGENETIKECFVIFQLVEDNCVFENLNWRWILKRK